MERLNSAWHRIREWAGTHVALTSFLLAFPLLMVFGGLFVHQLVVPSLQGPEIIVEDTQLRTAHEKNFDSLAWISIPDTIIDYPVQQARNNEFYLRRDAEGKEDIHGCIYADYECDLEDWEHLSRNLVLYGHTFSHSDYDGGFKLLHDYQKQEFGQEHPFIQVTIANATLTYQVFSVGCADTTTDFDCIYADPKDDAYQTILDKALSRSVYDFGVEVSTQDQILTLSTCTGYTPTRLLVIAKLVDVQPAGGDATT